MQIKQSAKRKAYTKTRFNRVVYHLSIVTNLLALGFCLLLGFLRYMRLPELPAPKPSMIRSVATLNAARSLQPMDSYIRLLKMRDLFKPSVPIPSENKVGKTTAEELAERLQFLGTAGTSGEVRALVFIPNRGPGLFKVGDPVAEFVLKEIQQEWITIQLEDEEIKLKK